MWGAPAKGVWPPSPNICFLVSSFSSATYPLHILQCLHRILEQRLKSPGLEDAEEWEGYGEGQHREAERSGERALKMEMRGSKGQPATPRLFGDFQSSSSYAHPMVTRTVPISPFRWLNKPRFLGSKRTSPTQVLRSVSWNRIYYKDLPPWPQGSSQALWPLSQLWAHPPCSLDTLGSSPSPERAITPHAPDPDSSLCLERSLLWAPIIQKLYLLERHLPLWTSSQLSKAREQPLLCFLLIF